MLMELLVEIKSKRRMLTGVTGLIESIEEAWEFPPEILAT